MTTDSTKQPIDLDAPAPITLIVAVRHPWVRITRLTDEERAVAESLRPGKA